MSTESEGFDPYGVVLADLKAKRDQIEQAIQAIEAIMGGSRPAPAPKGDSAPSASGAPGEFLGLSIADAAKKLLGSRKQAMGNADIAKALRDGGLVMSAKTDHQNIVGSVLTRRFMQVGDIVRVGRGIWGLKEWYPNRSFNTSAKANGDAPKSDPNEPAQPAEPTVDELLG